MLACNLLLVLTFSTLSIHGALDGRQGMNPLLNKLFRTAPIYNPRIRPINKVEQAKAVAIQVAFSHIEAVDEKQQTVKLHGMMAMGWIDQRLQWNFSEFNVTSLKLSNPLISIWKPDLNILNSHKPKTGTWRDFTYITNVGHVYTTTDFSTSITCAMSFIDYPRDRHRCRLVFGSFMYDRSQLVFSVQGVELFLSGSPLRTKRHAAGWEILNGTVDSQTKFLRNEAFAALGLFERGDSAEAQFPVFVVEFEFRRHKPYFELLELTPIVLVAILTLIAFRTDAPVTIFGLLLVCVLLQGIISWDMLQELPPATDGTPKIVLAYTFNLCATSMAFLIYVILERIGNRSTTSIFDDLTNRIDRNPLIRFGIDLRISNRKNRGSVEFVQFPVSIDQEQSGEYSKFYQISKRICFWIYLLSYLIFILVISFK